MTMYSFLLTESASWILTQLFHLSGKEIFKNIEFSLFAYSSAVIRLSEPVWNEAITNFCNNILIISLT